MAASSPPRGGISTSSGILVAVFTILTIACAVVGDGNVIVPLVPVLAAAAVYGLCKLPLRVPALGLLACGLLLEVPGEALETPSYTSPFLIPGMLIFSHLNLTVRVKALFFSIFDVVLLLLFSLALYRNLSRKDEVDRAGWVRTPSPILRVCFLGLFGTALMLSWGMTHGGEFSNALWQMNRLVYLPILILLYHLALRGRQDFRAVARIIVGIACLKACIGLAVRQLVPPLPGEETLPYATAHNDSMLFAGAFCLILALLFERYNRKNVLRALLILPVLVAGMWANNRRLVWLEVMSVFITLFMITPPNRLKRVLMRAAPVVLVYYLLGTQSNSKIFAPVKTLQSTADGKKDSSTRWRDMENYNLLYTIRNSPIMGKGYGNGYDENLKLPDISGAFALYRHIPHNTVLGLWAICGFVGFTLQWMLLPVGIFFTVRAYRSTDDRELRAACLSSLGMVVVYMVHSWGDLGMGTDTGIFTTAPAIVLCGKLCVENGVWVNKKQKIGDPAPRVIEVVPNREGAPETAALPLGRGKAPPHEAT